MRTFIATHRNDVDLSAMYKPLEDVFIQIGAGKDGGKDDPVFTLKRAEEQVIENYLDARDMDLVWGKANVDANGKPWHFTGSRSGDIALKLIKLLGTL